MRTVVVSLLVGVALGLAVPASAGEMRVADLLAAPDRFDGTEVTLVGELVGDFQRRGAMVWVQLNDDPYVTAPLHSGGPLAGTNLGVGVRFPTALFDAAGFVHPGGYRVRGPVVGVTGTWRYHDEARGGESYLSVESFVVIEGERAITEGGDWPVLLAGLVLVAIGLAVPALRRRTGSTSKAPGG